MFARIASIFNISQQITKLTNYVCSTEPVGRYTDETIVITLPAGITVFEVRWLSVWCDRFTVDFGHVMWDNNNILPPVYVMEQGDMPSEVSLASRNCIVL